MQKTLLYGKPVIPEKGMTDRLRSSARGGVKPKAIPRETWRMVMTEGLDACTVAKLEKEQGADGGVKTWQVCLRQIPESPADRVKYHNELMTLCGLTLRQLTDALKTGADKKDVRRARSRSSRRQQA